MHARTQDDFHPVGNLHIGTVAWPGLHTVSETTAMTGRAYLDALAAGYMVAVGLSRRFSPVTTPRGLRSTCLYAPFGASAAVARARGLDIDGIANALAFTTLYNTGYTQTWLDGSDEWQLHAGAGAETGLRAAEFAAAGLRGGDRALDGPKGFFAATVGREVAFAEIADDFDASAALEENVLKRYPVSGICQSVVLASEAVARRASGGPEAVRALRVDMNPFERLYPGNLNRGPFRSFSDKLMSAAFCASSVIASGRFEFDDFHAGPNEARDRLIDLAEIEPDERLPLLSCRVSLTLADGSILQETIHNSREDVALDWATIDPWAVELWQGAGRDQAAYFACRDAVRSLPDAVAVSIPF